MRKLLLLFLPILVAPSISGAGVDGRANRLINEKSPYLLQHASNPVNWYPWGEEAFEKARSEGKPIFLSIGYSTCHWCHVMERESFSNPDIARLLNEGFVSIKVDREERPDIDAMYQAFLTATGSDGGWPANIFLTPELEPFYGGTYFPPSDRRGQVGLDSIISRLTTAWSDHRDQVKATAEQMSAAIASLSAPRSSDEALEETLVTTAFEQLSSRYEENFGGFSPAPKFPQPSIHEFLLRYHVRNRNDRAAQMSLSTLRAMAAGGLYDQLAGGFHRYSADDEWLVPHFEKMLYDQAQLANIYISALQLTGDETFERVATETLDFVLLSMRSPEGGFYSALDASSLPRSGAGEKREGAYYTWTAEEASRLFDENEWPLIAAAYGIQDSGNVDPALDPGGDLATRNVLSRRVSVDELSKRFSLPPADVDAAIATARKKLLNARAGRPAPYLDDKILTSWNGLMISALARGSQVLDDERYLAAALDAARFAERRLRSGKDGHLWRRWRDGDAAVDGFAEDYAFLIAGLLDLYEASFDLHWVELARDLQEKQDELFWSGAKGYYSLTAQSENSPVVDVPGDVDSVLPSHNSVAVMNLSRLGQLTGTEAWQERSRTILTAFSGTLRSNPQTMPLMMAGLSSSLSKPKQIIIAGSRSSTNTRRLLRLVHERYLPDHLLILVDGDREQKRLSRWMPFVEYVQPIQGRATAYICENFVCKIPSNDTSVIRRQLDGPP